MKQFLERPLAKLACLCLLHLTCQTEHLPFKVRIRTIIHFQISMESNDTVIEFFGKELKPLGLVSNYHVHFGLLVKYVSKDLEPVYLIHQGLRLLSPKQPSDFHFVRE